MRTLPTVITSRTNARVKELRASLSGEARQLGDLLGVEGPKLIGEAHMAGMSFETVYLRQGSEAALGAYWIESLRVKNWAVLSPEVFDSAVSTSTPQGIAATWAIREPELQGRDWYAGLVLENIQDPGNLGTLIRSAMAFGMGDVAVTPESVNAWNPKVVRAAAGSIFAIRVRRIPLQQIVAELRERGARIFAGVGHFDNSPGRFPLMAAPHGVLTGRRLNGDLPGGPFYPEAPSGMDENQVDGYAASLSYDTDFLEPCAILIGNEGAGLSEVARALADEHVQIPCGTESLNAAVAGSVLMYEAMRQRVLRAWARKQGLRP